MGGTFSFRMPNSGAVDHQIDASSVLRAELR